MSGNRCGHDPRRPRLELAHPETRKPFVWLIARALERVEWLYYDRTIFPELGDRKRSERIEAMVLVAKAILRNTDRLTLRSGRHEGGQLVSGYTMKTIAKWARLTESKAGVDERGRARSAPQRAFRALWDLRDAGLVSCTQPIETRKDGSRRGLAGIRCPTPKLFERLGLGSRLRRERRELANAARKDQRAETIAERKRLRRLFRASHRASTLTKRTTHQLAEGVAPAPAPRLNTLAEIAAQLAAWRERNGGSNY